MTTITKEKREEWRAMCGSAEFDFEYKILALLDALEAEERAIAGYKAMLNNAEVRVKKSEKELEMLLLDYANLKMTTYDQAHSAGANLGYNNCREEMQPLLDKAEARAERLGRAYNLVMMELNSSHARIHGIDEAHADPERLK